MGENANADPQAIKKLKADIIKLRERTSYQRTNYTLYCNLHAPQVRYLQLDKYGFQTTAALIENVCATCYSRLHSEALSRGVAAGKAYQKARRSSNARRSRSSSKPRRSRGSSRRSRGNSKLRRRSSGSQKGNQAAKEYTHKKGAFPCVLAAIKYSQRRCKFVYETLKEYKKRIDAMSEETLLATCIAAQPTWTILVGVLKNKNKKQKKHHYNQ